MAAVARGLRIRVTPQERGSCDVSVKRLETGSFPMPQVTAGDGIEIQPAQLAMLLSGIDLRTAQATQAVPAPRPSPGGSLKSSELDLRNMKDRV